MENNKQIITLYTPLNINSVINFVTVINKTSNITALVLPELDKQTGMIMIEISSINDIEDI